MNRSMLPRLELCFGILLTAFILVLHINCLLTTGPLWRDEANTVYLAGMSDLAELWRFLEFDSFPILWPLVLRAWIPLGPAGADLWIRVLGFLVGVGAVGVLWWNARRLSAGIPIVSLILVGLSPAVLRFGDSLRAYGLGSLLVLCLVGAAWRLVEGFSRRRALAVAVLAVLSVLCLYHNSTLVFAALVGGMAVALRRRDLRTLGTLVAAGVLCVVVLLPFWNVIQRVHGWNALQKVSSHALVYLGRFAEAVNLPGDFMARIWLVLFPVALVFSWRGVFRRRPQAEPDRDVLLFSGTAMATGAGAYLTFLLVLSYPTEPWHFVAIVTFLGTVLDAPLYLLVRDSPRGRAVRLGLFILLAAVLAPAAWRWSRVRQTNADLVARELETRTSKDDFIVVCPWWDAVSFGRYYRGPAPWVTVPEMDDHRAHRYDLCKAKMMEQDPMGPTLARISRTLQAGNRVWLVGECGFPLLGEKRIQVTPLPRGSRGDNATVYIAAWWQQVAFLVLERAAELRHIIVPANMPVNVYEELSLNVAKGWRGPPGDGPPEPVTGTSSERSGEASAR